MLNLNLVDVAAAPAITNLCHARINTAWHYRYTTAPPTGIRQNTETIEVFRFFGIRVRSAGKHSKIEIFPPIRHANADSQHNRRQYRLVAERSERITEVGMDMLLELVI